jgi:hypothetical protein
MSTAIPSTEHIIRYVPWKLLIKGEDEVTVVGVFPQAFDLRDNEEYLSVTWVEHFSGVTICDRLHSAVQTFRKTMSAGAKSRYLMGNVGAVHRICDDNDKRVRIVHEPDENPGHVAIRRFPKDDLELASQLIEEAFTAHINNRDVP